MPRLGDVYGRKPVFIYCLLAQGVFFAIATFWHNLLVLYVSAFLIGPMYIGRLAAGFCLLMELVPKAVAPKVGAALMVCQGSVLIYWSIYFKWISNNSTYFLGLGVILNFVTAFICFVIPESPRYLYGRDKFDQCRESLAIIARRNGILDFKPPHFQKEDELLMEIDDEDAIDEIKSRKTEAFGHLLAAGETRPTEGGKRMTRKTKTLVDEARKTRGTRKSKARYMTTAR
jgi:MFS family permease